MKSIKDYLHLYMGCEVLALNPFSDETTPSHAYLTGITGMDELNVELQFHNGVHADEEPAYLKYEDVKPILRPLSDMTDEEAIELVKIVEWEHYGIHPHARKYSAFKNHFNNWVVSWGESYREKNVPQSATVFFPEQIRFLLSKHFDVFDLTKEGLAIDATTLKLEIV